jgi:hypothetical protein
MIPCAVLTFPRASSSPTALRTSPASAPRCAPPPSAAAARRAAPSRSPLLPPSRAARRPARQGSPGQHRGPHRSRRAATRHDSAPDPRSRLHPHSRSAPRACGVAAVAAVAAAAAMNEKILVLREGGQDVRKEAFGAEAFPRQASNTACFWSLFPWANQASISRVDALVLEPSLSLWNRP